MMNETDGVVTMSLHIELKVGWGLVKGGEMGPIKSNTLEVLTG